MWGGFEKPRESQWKLAKSHQNRTSPFANDFSTRTRGIARNFRDADQFSRIIIAEENRRSLAIFDRKEIAHLAASTKGSQFCGER